MTQKDLQTDIPSTGDQVDLHRDLAVDHATRAVTALTELENTAIQDRRGTLLNQQIGVHVKLAGVHADLALAVAQSSSRVSYDDVRTFSGRTIA